MHGRRRWQRFASAYRIPVMQRNRAASVPYFGLLFLYIEKEVVRSLVLSHKNVYECTTQNLTQA